MDELEVQRLQMDRDAAVEALQAVTDALRNLIAASGDYENEYGHEIELEWWWTAQGTLNGNACVLPYGVLDADD